MNNVVPKPENILVYFALWETYSKVKGMNCFVQNISGKSVLWETEWKKRFLER